jgi:hypothetical protein
MLANLTHRIGLSMPLWRWAHETSVRPHTTPLLERFERPHTTPFAERLEAMTEMPERVPSIGFLP